MQEFYRTENGVVCVEPYEDNEAWVFGLHVARDARSNGEGRELMAAVVAAADEAGVALWLTADPFPVHFPHAELVAWYERLGFVTTEPKSARVKAVYMRREPARGNNGR